MKKKTVFICQAGVIAAIYAGLTYLSSVFGIAYGAVQFRFSELMTILPLFTPAAVPGLFIGCIVANIASPLVLVDVVFGSIATLLAAACTRALRRFCIKDLPLAAFFPPVIFNMLIVGWELTIFVEEQASVAVFAYNAFCIGLGEAVICLIFGIPFFYFIKRTRIFNFQNSERKY